MTQDDLQQALAIDDDTKRRARLCTLCDFAINHTLPELARQGKSMTDVVARVEQGQREIARIDQT